jgi:molybdenum cofactor biosynthesis protein B
MAPHHRARVARHVQCAIVTVSDTRTTADDRSGVAIRTALEGAGHSVAFGVIVPDEVDAIRSAVVGAAERKDVEVVIVTGGTGIAPRDVTIESLRGLWSKELPGFGEIFRALSYDEIGPAAFLSRATAGIIAASFVVILPGSPGACELALTRLLLPELAHIVDLLGKTAGS